jgi:hypothetical protein
MRTRTFALVFLLALMALLATAAPAAAPSGLRGVVMRGPITPVCRDGVPCSALARNTPLVFTRAGRSVTTRTDAAGRYRIALSPGVWNVRTATAPRVGTGISPATALVLAGRFRMADFDIDTGIR